MKKKIIIISILVVLIITLLLIPKDIYKKIFNKDDEKTDEPAVNLVYQTLFVRNSQDKLVGIKVGTEKIEEDIVGQKWDLLTTSSNLIPSGYSSPINTSTTLYSHVTENNQLILNVSEEVMDSYGRITIECLAWNFCDDTIKEVVVKVNDQEIDHINDYYFNTISKNLGTNFVFEAKDLFSSNYLTVVYYSDDQIMPVTFFYDDTENIYDYAICKMFKNDEKLTEIVTSKAYTYRINDTELVINMNYEGSLSETIINTVLETTKLNFSLSNLTINGTQTVMLEQSFIGEKTE